jgi:hypothetical protein
MASKRGSTSGKKKEEERLAFQSDDAIHGHQVDDEMIAEMQQAHAAMTTPTKPINNHGATRTMSIIEFQTSLADAEKPVPLPAGEYTAEIRKAEVKISAAGNEYLALQCYISPDEYPADFADGDPDGTVLTFNRLVISNKPQDRWRMRRFLETVGMKLGSSLDVNELMGLGIKVRTSVSSYEGEDRAEIKSLVTA